jgi:hypothetical protein
MAEQVAVVHARATAEPAHRIAHLAIDQRVHDDRRMPACRRDRALEVGDRVAARMPDLLELLLGELRLQRLHEAGRGLTRGVGDDVKLDGHVFRLIDS